MEKERLSLRLSDLYQRRATIKRKLGTDPDIRFKIDKAECAGRITREQARELRRLL